jgi:hypothetical protein
LGEWLCFSRFNRKETEQKKRVAKGWFPKKENKN